MKRHATPQPAFPSASPRTRLQAFAGALILAASACLLAPAAGAATYKWVDANGRVVYSDQPPPGDIKTEIVKPPPPPANPNAAQELVDRELDLKQRDKKRAEDAKAADKSRQDATKKRELCVNALGQMKAMQDKNSLLYRFNDKGEKIYYDDEMRRSEFERQQQAARESCPG